MGLPIFIGDRCPTLAAGGATARGGVTDLLGVMGAEPSLGGAAVDACEGVRGEASSHVSNICCSLRELSGEGSGDGSGTRCAQTICKVLSIGFSDTFSRSGSL